MIEYRMVWRVALVGLMVGWLIGVSQPSLAQEQPSAGRSENESEVPQRQGLHFNSIGRTPQTIVYPGGTLVLNATVSNYNDTPESGVLVATAEGVQNLQSARRITVAPQRLEHLPLYIQLPNSIAGKDRVQVRVVLYVEENGREVIQDQAGEPAEHVLTFTVAKVPSVAALILNPEPPRENPWVWPPPPAYWSYELVIGARVDAGGSRLTAGFDQGNYPLNLADWEAVRLMVISQPDCLRDAALVESLKSFMAGGGRLWVMLDHVPCEAVRPLLGVGQSVELVDEVEINHGVVEMFEAKFPLSEADRTIDSDDPLRMVRVVQSGGHVSHAVDGWPLAIWMRYGQGEILLTTLDAQAWIRPRDATPEATDAFQQAQFTTRPWVHQLALDANTDPGMNPMDRAFEYPVKHIGDPVVPRRWVAVSLFIFCVAVAGFSTWCWRVGAKTQVLWGVPAIAAVVSAALVGSAGYVRQDVAAGVARLQLVQVIDDGSRALVREQSGVYLTGEADMALEAHRDGEARASENISTGIQRFEVTGFHEWRLHNPAWPPGVWRYDAEYTQPYHQAIAEIQLSDDEMRIELPVGFDALEDPILGYNVGNPVICRRSDQTRVLLADGQLRAAGDRWVADSLISAEQLRRTGVYKRLFAPLEHGRGLQRVVFGWSDLSDGRPEWSSTLEERGAALVAIPVRLRRPPAGESVFVPQALVQLRTDRQAVGQTSTYDNDAGRWASELTMHAEARLEFDVPEELLPFEAEQALFHFDIRAPHRDVELSAILPDGTSRQIVELTNPSLPWNGSVEDPAILQALGTGRLRLLLRVSDRTDVSDSAEASNVVSWEVRELSLALRGAVARSHDIER